MPKYNLTVAPRVGAWIETGQLEHLRGTLRSPLAWGRGSKPSCSRNNSRASSSPLAWGRGSKPVRAANADLLRAAAPRVGAWIETLSTCG